MKVIGIDPGTAILGWAYVETDSHGELDKLTLKYGAITTLAGLSMPDRLLKISQELKELFKDLKPDIVGVEELFFSKNVKTAITVAEARGVILVESRRCGAIIVEMKPVQVKEGIVGYGRADKAQVQNMVKMLMNLKEIPKPDDAADAVAVAICAAQIHNLNSRIEKAG